jgi:5-methylcytosine-specific restriction endonuclease McrA
MAAYSKEYQSRANVKAKRAVYVRKPEFRATANRRRKNLYDTPNGNVNLRMSAAVRRSLKGAVKSSRWVALVGYTVEQLRVHLERQFLPKMGWHNMPEWHVDHIVPLSSFEFESADDLAFKAAWALTNLRPIWATENLRKSARREFLL